MKKYLVLFLVGAGFTATSFAQKENDEKEEKKGKVTVPAAVKLAFAKKYPGAKAAWSMEANAEYEAGFIQAGHEMSVVFDAAGTLMETETEIKAAELPPAVMPYIKAHYKNAKVKETAKITKANGEVLYEAEVNKTDLMFDAAGKFIKEAKG